MKRLGTPIAMPSERRQHRAEGHGRLITRELFEVPGSTYTIEAYYHPLGDTYRIQSQVIDEEGHPASEIFNEPNLSTSKALARIALIEDAVKAQETTGFMHVRTEDVTLNTGEITHDPLSPNTVMVDLAGSRLTIEIASESGMKGRIVVELSQRELKRLLSNGIQGINVDGGI